MNKMNPNKTYWYVPEWCRFAIPVKVLEVDEGFGKYNCLVWLDEPIGHMVYLNELAPTLKDAIKDSIFTRDEDRNQEIHNSQFERVNFKNPEYKNWQHLHSVWRRMRIDGINGVNRNVVPDNTLMLTDSYYPKKKAYRF